MWKFFVFSVLFVYFDIIRVILEGSSVLRPSARSKTSVEPRNLRHLPHLRHLRESLRLVILHSSLFILHSS